MPGLPTISVLVRTLNSARTLERVFSMLPLRLGDEILVVDSGSSDRTLEIASKFNCRILRLQLPFNYSQALNLGFEHARNPWVLVLSSHCIPIHMGMLERMREVAASADPKLAVAYGVPCLREPATVLSKVEPIGIKEWEAGRTRCGGNALALYRAALWHQHRFDESLVTAEDLAWLIWALESGYQAATVHDALGLYRNQGSLRHMFRKGWHESRMAVSLLRDGQGRWTLLQSVQRLGLCVGHYGLLFLKRKIPFATFLRQAAHGFGAFSASVVAPRPDDNGFTGIP